MSLPEILCVAMSVALCAALLLGFPVAFTLAGVALLFAGLGSLLGAFDLALLGGMPSRVFGIMTNEVLVAVPLFVFMGVALERSQLAERLLSGVGALFGSMRNGLGIAVVIVGMLMAASTGIVGATVVTMGLLSLPTMLKAGYDPRLATGTICASGTLGQIIPPSIVLILLADVLQGANIQAQLALGNFAPDSVSVLDLFAGAFLPGLLLVTFYLLWQFWSAWRYPDSCPAVSRKHHWRTVARDILPLVALIIAVLGSILAGIATPTESAAVGAAGAIGLARWHGHLTLTILRQIMEKTAHISAMIFTILIGASVFSLVFRGLEGDQLVASALGDLPGGRMTAMIILMVGIFLLGFILDFIEIIFVVVPILGPVLLGMGFDPVWFGVMIALNLQTSFLTPPFGFALFYLRGVAPSSVKTYDIYRGAIPFIILQIVVLGLLAVFPSLATWLPKIIFS